MKNLKKVHLLMFFAVVAPSVTIANVDVQDEKNVEQVYLTRKCCNSCSTNCNCSTTNCNSCGKCSSSCCCTKSLDDVAVVDHSVERTS